MVKDVLSLAELEARVKAAEQSRKDAEEGRRNSIGKRTTHQDSLNKEMAAKNREIAAKNELKLRKQSNELLMKLVGASEGDDKSKGYKDVVSHLHITGTISSVMLFEKLKERFPKGYKATIAKLIGIESDTKLNDEYLLASLKEKYVFENGLADFIPLYLEGEAFLAAGKGIEDFKASLDSAQKDFGFLMAEYNKVEKNLAHIDVSVGPQPIARRIARDQINRVIAENLKEGNSLTIDQLDAARAKAEKTAGEAHLIAAIKKIAANFDDKAFLKDAQLNVANPHAARVALRNKLVELSHGINKSDILAQQMAAEKTAGDDAVQELLNDKTNRLKLADIEETRLESENLVTKYILEGLLVENNKKDNSLIIAIQRDFGDHIAAYFDEKGRHPGDIEKWHAIAANAAEELFSIVSDFKLKNPDVQIILGADSQEIGFPPEIFKKIVEKAQREGIRIAFHAGEEPDPAIVEAGGDPAEYVRQCLEMGSDAILHGNAVYASHEKGFKYKVTRDDNKKITKLELVENKSKNIKGIKTKDNDEVASLAQIIAHLEIPLFMCPVSNVALNGMQDVKEHPAVKLIEIESHLPDEAKKNIKVVVNNPDDPGYFLPKFTTKKIQEKGICTIKDVYRSIIESGIIYSSEKYSPLELLHTFAQNAIKCSFMGNETQKQNLLKENDNHYNKFKEANKEEIESLGLDKAVKKPETNVDRAQAKASLVNSRRL